MISTYKNYTGILDQYGNLITDINRLPVSSQIVDQNGIVISGANRFQVDSALFDSSGSSITDINRLPVKSHIDELGSTISVNTGTQLKTTIYDSSGLEIKNYDPINVSLGSYPNAYSINCMGVANDFDTSDSFVTVWDGSNDSGIDQMNYNYSSSADIDSIVSSSAGDTVSIEIQGLNSSYNRVSESVALNGQTRVALTTNLIRVFSIKNIGSTNNLGTVYCYVNGSITAGVPDDLTTVRAVILPGKNKSSMCMYTIPADKTGFLMCFFAYPVGVSMSATYNIDVKYREFGSVFIAADTASISDAYGGLNKKYQLPISLPEKTDIEIQSMINTAAITGAAISSSFDLIIIDN